MIIVVQENLTSYRFVLLMAGGIFAVFGSRTVHFSGAGPLGVLTIAFVAALQWRKEISAASEVHFFIDAVFLVVELSIHKSYYSYYY